MSISQLRAFIEAELGIMMPPGKEALLRARLQRRVRELGLSSLDEYFAIVRREDASSGELRELIGAITTNTTEFFREPAHIDFLVRRIVPERLAAERGATVTIWSAGCSTGEEPYSIAMALSEAVGASLAWDFRVLATDISPRVLDQARRGVYEDDRVGGVSPGLANRYLMRPRDRTQGCVRVSAEIRAKVTFHELNFMREVYDVPTGFDAIFFRNVAIYFDQATQEAVVARLSRHLRPGGYLLLGQAESLIGRSVPVRQVGPALYRRELAVAA